MKTGRTLEELLVEVKRQRDTKRDFVAPTTAISIVPSQAGIEMAIGDDATRENGRVVKVNSLAHRQLGENLKIPAGYYDRMLNQAPDLLAINANAWLRKEPEKRMVRTLDGSARAFLSDRYRPLDNADLLEAALPSLLDMGVKVLSTEVTDRRLYLKVVDKRIERDLKGKGKHEHFDTVSPALVLSNSEVGAGALALQTSIFTGGCTNLVIIRERSMRKYHVGGRHELGEETYAMLSDRTKTLKDQALWAELHDVVKAAFDRAKFDAICDKLEIAAGERIEGEVVKVVEVTAKRFGMTDTEGKSVLDNLIKSGDLTQYGLHAAITRTAQDLESYDRASEFEAIGGEVIELPKTEWKELALAA